MNYEALSVEDLQAKIKGIEEYYSKNSGVKLFTNDYGQSDYFCIEQFFKVENLFPEIVELREELKKRLETL